MTQEQKEKLSFQVHMHQKKSFADDEIRFLNDGDTIEFTHCTNYSTNSVYEINNTPSWKIWYSQLANYFLDEDLNVMVTKVEFRDGTSYTFESLDSADLYKKCKGKRFRVTVVHDLKYTFNRKSEIAEKKKMYSYQEVYDYINLCVDTNTVFPPKSVSTEFMARDAPPVPKI